MIDIKILKKSPYFKTRTLEKSEYLFKQGEKDDNIYIILVGELKVEKYINSDKKDTKTLAILKKDDIFGEASLNSNEAKQVSIKANKKTELLYINAINGLNKFREENIDQAFNLLKYIIYVSNNRLNISNELITSSYTISNEIINLKDFSYKTIFKLIEKIKKITKTDEEIIFLEENPVLKEYLTIKYKTKEPNKMQNEIIKVHDNKLDLLNLKINGKYNYTQKLQIGDKNYGYLVFIRNQSNFTENEIKILSTMSTSLAGVLKQKEFLKEQSDKEYIKNI